MRLTRRAPLVALFFATRPSGTLALSYGTLAVSRVFGQDDSYKVAGSELIIGEIAPKTGTTNFTYRGSNGEQHKRKTELQTDELAQSANHALLRVGIDMSTTKGYEVGWALGIALLVLATVGYRISVPAQGTDNTWQKKLTTISTGSSQTPTDSFLQQGYAHSFVGRMLYLTWIGLPFFGYVQMALFSEEVYMSLLYNPPLSWESLAQAFLLIFVVSHLAFFLLSRYLGGARVFFMIPCALESADEVLIKNPMDPAASTLVHVVLDEAHEQSVRYFEYTCVRYIWRDTEMCFVPVGIDDGLTGIVAASRLEAGGLGSKEISARSVAGENAIHMHVPGRLYSLGSEFLDPIYCFQFGCIWVYMFYSSWNIAVVWLALVVTSGCVKSLLIVRANQLKIQELTRNDTPATVQRDGEWVTLRSSDLVPGDVVRVDETSVGCDLVLAKGSAVVNESMLTGEPMPVQRFEVDPKDSITLSASTHKKHFLFAGTKVMQSVGPAEGRAVGIAIATGPRTAKGDLVRMVLFPSPISFRFSDELGLVYLLMFMYVLSLFTLCLLNDAGSWIVSVFTGLCILTQSLNPNLPVSLSMGCAVAAHRMKEVYGINCLSPGRIPVAGKLHVMVMDKTGTITKDGMDFAGVHAAEEDGRSFRAGGVEVDPAKLPQTVGWALAACHTVTKMRDGSLVGNMVECEMVRQSGWELSEDSRTLRRKADAADEISILKQLEFDHHRMTSGAVVRVKDKELVLVKGSYERIGELLSGGTPLKYDEITAKYASAQYYVIGLGFKYLDSGSEKTDRAELEEGLTFLGLLLFRNELKPDSPQAVASFRESGLRGVICTGDNALTGAAIGERCGLMGAEASYSFKPGEMGISYDDNGFVDEVSIDGPAQAKGVKKGYQILKVGTEVFSKDALVRAEKTGFGYEVTVSKPTRVILGDVSGDGLKWVRHPNGGEVPHSEVLQAEETDIDLVLTKTAFVELLRPERDEMKLLLQKVRVYARMKPDDKVKVIQLHQDRGWVVGMVGDGGNDCGALRTAHVGLALSEAEASIVAPFSSGAEYGTKSKSLMALVHLLRFGRATLATNSATLCFFLVYGFTLPTSKLVVVFLGNAMFAEWQFLFIDILLGALMVAAMTACWPSEKLAVIRPTGALLGLRTFSMIFAQVAIVALTYVIGLGMLMRQNFYLPYNSVRMGVPGNEWPKKCDNYEVATTFLIIATQLATSGFAYSLGAEHRESVLRNVRLVTIYTLAMVIIFILLWGGPSDFHCILRINCDQRTSRTMDIPIVAEVSVGGIGGCFLGPQIEEYKARFGDSFQFPTYGNQCQPKPGFDVEAALVPSGAISGLGNSFCAGANNCFSASFRADMSYLLLAQVLASLSVHKLLMMWHPGQKEHFKRL